MPLVSVVMPVYNSAATLGAAVRSVLTQTHSDLELLITDDKSSDGSMDLLMEFARQDKRVVSARAEVQPRVILPVSDGGAFSCPGTTKRPAAR